MLGSGSCSALVKLMPGNSDLFVSHDTWDVYDGMLRIFKNYDLKFSTNGSGKWEEYIVSQAPPSFLSL